MNATTFTTILKILLALLAIIVCAGACPAQNQESGDSLIHELREVVITARQPATRLEGSTLVSTIPGSNLADLGTAMDVLAQLPMLKVEDGAVGVIGKGNIEIYIDGRPMRDGAELEQILSSNLKKVELLMAPGAAYSSTIGAVLKITTRRNFARGLSVTDRFMVQRKRRWSATEYLGLNYRAGDLEFFIDGNISRNNSVVKGTTTNRLVYNGRPTIVGSSQHNSYPATTAIVKGGFNYAKDTQSFGAYYRYNPERAHFTNIGAEWLNDNVDTAREIDKHTREHGHLASAYYENQFADKYVLHFDGDFRHSVASGDVATRYPSSPYPTVNSTDSRNSTLWAGKLYLNLPLAGGELTAGTQDSYTHTRLDYRMLNTSVEEYIPSSVTDARQTSAAAFASWGGQFGNFSVSAGARYEYVDYDFRLDSKRDEAMSRRTHLLTPDLALSYFFNDDTQLSLSYKMATVKPPYSQLTGSLSYVGLHEIEGGNPALRDEKMHDVQLFGLWRGFMLQADYTRSADTYAFVKQPYPAANLQLLMHPVNIDMSALNVYLIWSRSVRRWTPEATLGVYRQWLTLGGEHHDRPIFSYYFDNTFALPGGWTLTANFSGQTRGDMHTNRFGATAFTMDASLGKTFMGKALTVKISATDIFNTANNDWTMNTCGVFVDKRQSYYRRGVSLNVIYNFQPRKSKYKGSPAAEAEMNRL
ncbi:MAG: TonB-dependent receptor [Muribaculaceae bacterium]|nr:TonB-dependent receptor [Muribaculaceae bacterium]